MKRLKSPRNGYSLFEAVRYEPLRLEDCLIRDDSAIDPSDDETIEKGEE